MGDTQENQAETPVEEKQPESNETPLTQERFEEIQKELEKAKNQANTFQGLLKEAQRKTITKEDLTSIYDRIDGQQRWIATALDDIRGGFDGNYGEPQATRKSYTTDVEEHINKSRESRQPPKDPVVEKFFDYLTDEGLDWESDFVRDAVKDTDTPQSALKAVKAAVKERDKAKVLADVRQETEEGKNRLREELLKEYGLTSGGVGQPSAANVDIRSMTPDEKLNYGFQQAKKKK